jgi:hypothetical protein
MRILAFLTDPPVVSAILLHPDLPHKPPPLSPARGPPQNDLLTGLLDQTPTFDPAEPDPVPDFEFDQSLPTTSTSEAPESGRPTGDSPATCSETTLPLGPNRALHLAEMRTWPSTHGARHPFVIGVNRLAASRWLLQSGDTAAAGSLLLLHQTDLPSTLHPLPAANIILGSYGLATLARVEARRGRSELAERYRRIAGEQADL